MERRRTLSLVRAVCALIATLCPLASAQYGGGSGTDDEPYLVYTAEQLNAIGAEPNDWYKHFKLMADIDLSPYDGQNGRPAFNIIGPLETYRRIDGFTGVFDGGDHIISNFSYVAQDQHRVGLFGYVNDNAHIKNLHLTNPMIDAATGDRVGALVGNLEYGTISNCSARNVRISGRNNVGGLVGAFNVYASPSSLSEGVIQACHATGSVVGQDAVGGLVGGIARGLVTTCHSETRVNGETRVGGLVGFLEGGTIRESFVETRSVSGGEKVGGLVGQTYYGTVESSYAISIVSGDEYTGGLLDAVGKHQYSHYEGQGPAQNCYAEGIVIGKTYTGGLMGANYGGSIVNCYATALVIGGEDTGGLIGIGEAYLAVASFWDIQTSRQPTSAAGESKTTAQMQSAATFRAWRESPHENIWTIDEGNDYPRLWWENRPGSPIGPPEFVPPFSGSGTEEDPYLIYTADQLNAIGADPNTWDKHFKLMADIDLSGFADTEFNRIGLEWGPPFSGVFDGNDHTIANFRCTSPSSDFVGIFRHVGGPNAEIKNLGLIAPYVSAYDVRFVGALIGYFGSGMVADCHVENGAVAGDQATGALVGYNASGNIVRCYSTGTVAGNAYVGGLVGNSLSDTIEACYSSCLVIGNSCVGGLAGAFASIEDSYATGMVIGCTEVGGLLGGARNAIVRNCYSVGVVVGDLYAGGLIGEIRSDVTASFWDIEASGQFTSDGGMGLGTAEMQMAATFLAAGWDFVGETDNGVEDIWWIDEGQDYPRLWREPRD